MPSVPQVRAAIIGAGVMGRWHADAVARIGGRVTIVADPDGDRASALADEHGASSTIRISEALSTVVADVAHVCTPADEHVYAVRASLESGLHVLAEKPLAPSAAITAELYALAAIKNLLLCPTHQTLFQDGVRRLIRGSEGIGRIRHISVEMCSAGANGGNAAARDQLVADVLSHPLSLGARLIPGGIAGTQWQATRACAGEVAIIGTRDGLTFSIVVSTRGRPTRNTLSVVGEAATFHADLFHGFAFAESRPPSRLGKIVRPFGNAIGTLRAASGNLARRAARREQAFPGLRELIRLFYEGVRSHGAPPISVAEALDVAAARDTIMTALRIEGAMA
jgi:predicted dehydrogenase